MMKDGQTRRAVTRPSTRRPSKRGMLGLVLLPLCVVSFAWAEAPLQVEWKEGLLSVIAEKTPLTQILREIVRQTGMEVQGLERLQGDVSVRFSALPLGEGLRRLLVNVNYAIIEDVAAQAAKPAHALFFSQQPNRAEGMDGTSGVQREDERAVLEAARQPTRGVQREDERAVLEAARQPTRGVQREDERVAEASVGPGGEPRKDERAQADMLTPHTDGARSGHDRTDADAGSRQQEAAQVEDELTDASR
jgi:hypothetical protein